MPQDLTQTQTEAMQKAWDILTEHFDAVVLTACVRAEGGSENEIRLHYRYGGYATAVGLIETHKAFLLSRYGREEQDVEPPE